MIEIYKYKRKADESVLSIVRVIMVRGIHLCGTHPLTRGGLPPFTPLSTTTISKGCEQRTPENQTDVKVKAN